jgi:hypothetical protein
MSKDRAQTPGANSSRRIFPSKFIKAITQREMDGAMEMEKWLVLDKLTHSGSITNNS